MGCSGAAQRQRQARERGGPEVQDVAAQQAHRFMKSGLASSSAAWAAGFGAHGLARAFADCRAERGEQGVGGASLGQPRGPLHALRQRLGLRQAAAVFL